MAYDLHHHLNCVASAPSSRPEEFKCAVLEALQHILKVLEQEGIDHEVQPTTTNDGD